MAVNLCFRLYSVTVLLYAALYAGSITKVNGEIECYVCSFNPYEVLQSDERENSTTRAPEWWQLGNDTCTWERFDPTRTRTAPCERGCEIVKMTDGNGELEMFYRNCLTRPEVTYEFVKTTNRLNDEEVYTCDSRLCNGSISPTAVSNMVFFFSVALLIHSKTRP